MTIKQSLMVGLSDVELCKYKIPANYGFYWECPAEETVAGREAVTLSEELPAVAAALSSTEFNIPVVEDFPTTVDVLSPAGPTEEMLVVFPDDRCAAKLTSPSTSMHIGRTSASSIPANNSVSQSEASQEFQLIRLGTVILYMAAMSSHIASENLSATSKALSAYLIPKRSRPDTDAKQEHASVVPGTASLLPSEHLTSL